MQILTVINAPESLIICLMLDPLEPIIAPTAEFGIMTWHCSIIGWFALGLYIE